MDAVITVVQGETRYTAVLENCPSLEPQMEEDIVISNPLYVEVYEDGAMDPHGVAELKEADAPPVLDALPKEAVLLRRALGEYIEMHKDICHCDGCTAWQLRAMEMLKEWSEGEPVPVAWSIRRLEL